MLKGGVWYLVARRSAGMRVYRVSRVAAVRAALEALFERPTRSSSGVLGASGRATSSSGSRASRSRSRVTEDVRRYLPGEPRVESDGRAVLAFAHLGDAYRELLRFGAQLEVLEPVELRERHRATRAARSPRCTLARRASLTTYGLFILTALALLAIPGPAVLYVVSRSIDQGRSAGLASVFGITTGTVVHVTLAAVGLSSLVLASHVAFDSVRYVGAAYLVFLGVRRLLTKRAHDGVEPRRRRAAGAISTRRGSS